MYPVKRQPLELEEGLRLLEEAYHDYTLANLKRRGFGNKKVPRNIEEEVDRELNAIYNRVDGIMMTCPQIKDFIDYKDVFFNHVFIENDLPNLINAIKKTLASPK